MRILTQEKGENENRSWKGESDLMKITTTDSLDTKGWREEEHFSDRTIRFTLSFSKKSVRMKSHLQVLCLCFLQIPSDSLEQRTAMPHERGSEGMFSEFFSLLCQSHFSSSPWHWKRIAREWFHDHGRELGKESWKFEMENSGEWERWRNISLHHFPSLFLSQNSLRLVLQKMRARRERENHIRQQDFLLCRSFGKRDEVDDEFLEGDLSFLYRSPKFIIPTTTSHISYHERMAWREKETRGHGKRDTEKKKWFKSVK